MTDISSTRPAPWRRVVGSPWFHLVAAFVVAGLILSFVVKPFWVPSGSMQATLEPGDRILVNRLAYLGAQPGTGDVVVFDAGAAWGVPSAASANPLRWAGEVTGFGPSGPHTLVKRVIGAAGQTVECCSADGRVVVDGEPLDEPYVTNDLAYEPGRIDCDTTPRSPRCFDPILVPADSYLVLGDNRGSSSDSAAQCRTENPAAACWRWATRDGIVGKAAVILWPISRWSGL
ncbi:signal peptidase I [Microbacterium sp. NPDC056569]|uniref:signal peptidase I n=1 Tax=Microbacterium sp. NPDC056569 TaxID=3345867 RepID=UPI00366DA17C